MYARKYSITVLGFEKTKAYFNVSSVDIAPSNMAEGGTNLSHGQFSFDFAKSQLDSKDYMLSLLTRAARTKDGSFFVKYGNKMEIRVFLK